MLECGDSSGGAFLVGTVQLIATALILFVYPPVETTLYTYTPSLVNQTLSGKGHEHGTTVHLALPCMTASLLTALFASMTTQGAQAGLISEANQYGTESPQDLGPWDVTFWATACITHAVAVAAITSPGGIFAFSLSLCLLMHALYGLCAPPPQAQNSYERARPIGLHFGVVEYLAGMIVAFNQVPTQYPNRYIVLGIMGMFDYFLCVGHTWDRAPTTLTIANCRLCYVAAVTLASVSMYGAWHDSLLFAH
jgi:hypothetical protein